MDSATGTASSCSVSSSQISAKAFAYVWWASIRFAPTRRVSFDCLSEPCILSLHCFVRSLVPVLLAGKKNPPHAEPPTNKKERDICNCVLDSRRPLGSPDLGSMRDIGNPVYGLFLATVDSHQSSRSVGTTRHSKR